MQEMIREIIITSSEEIGSAEERWWGKPALPTVKVEESKCIWECDEKWTPKICTQIYEAVYV